MSWNYRVVKFVGRHDTSYAVHEVHYAADGTPEMYTENSIGPSGESASGDARLDFEHSYTIWSRAIERTVLIVDLVTGQFTGREEPPIFTRATPPPCPDCGRPMTRREPWTCANCGEEWEL